MMMLPSSSYNWTLMWCPQWLSADRGKYPDQAWLCGIALGYEDINDHDTLRNDPAIKLLASSCHMSKDKIRQLWPENPPSTGWSIRGRPVIPAITRWYQT
jgi:hypothetical protein